MFESEFQIGNSGSACLASALAQAFSAEKKSRSRTVQEIAHTEHRRCVLAISNIYWLPYRYRCATRVLEIRRASLFRDHCVVYALAVLSARCARGFAATLLLAVTCFPALDAQTHTASLAGRVLDPSGGVVIGARVEATEQATQRRHATATDSLGQYRFCSDCARAISSRSATRKRCWALPKLHIPKETIVMQKLALVSLTLTILTFGGVAGSSDLVPAIAYDYTKLYEKVSPSVFKIEVDSGHGSGFLVDSRGLIATNHHVIRNTRYLAVKVSESLTVPAEIIVSSSRYDLGIVKVHEKFVEGIDPLPVLSHDREDTIREGVPVVAFGFAFVNKLDCHSWNRLQGRGCFDVWRLPNQTWKLGRPSRESQW